MQEWQSHCSIYVEETAISQEAGYKLTSVTTSFQSPTVLTVSFHHPTLFVGIKLNEHFDGEDGR